MTKRLFIFGAQNFADMAHYLFSTDSDYRIAAFVVDAAYLRESTFNGLPVIAFEELDTTFDRTTDEIFVAIGVARINQARADKVRLLQQGGYRLASFVSSHARVPADLVVRPNTMIMDQVNIHPRVHVGENTIIWSNSRIAMKVHVGDHVWITSALMGDSSRVGDHTFVGINATIAPFVKVGSHNLIGAAATILQDTSDYQVFRGPRSVASRVSSLRVQNLSLIR